jgi:hypothetical protein
MKYQAVYIPNNFIYRGFKTEEEAWTWIVNNGYCSGCQELEKKGKSTNCSGEWDVEEQDSLWQRFLIWIEETAYKLKIKK